MSSYQIYQMSKVKRETMMAIEDAREETGHKNCSRWSRRCCYACRSKQELQGTTTESGRDHPRPVLKRLGRWFDAWMVLGNMWVY